MRSRKRASRSGAETALPMVLASLTMVALASCPFSWPPMPSATSHTPHSGSANSPSSFTSRTFPVWVAEPVSKRNVAALMRPPWRRTGRSAVRRRRVGVRQAGAHHHLGAVVRLRRWSRRSCARHSAWLRDRAGARLEENVRHAVAGRQPNGHARGRVHGRRGRFGSGARAAGAGSRAAKLGRGVRLRSASRILQHAGFDRSEPLVQGSRSVGGSMIMPSGAAAKTVSGK
jgi:hypothetical protein